MRDYLLNFIFKFQRRFVGFYRKSKLNQRSELSTAVLTDFPKGFGCIPRNLLMAELGVSAFDRKSLALISAYLKHTKQKKNLVSFE